MNIDSVIGLIFCKECPNARYVASIDEYYCDKYSIEIEDISREFCEIELDD